MILGKPGGGKSMIAVQELIDELARGNRNICTNLPLELDPWVSGSGIAQHGLLEHCRRKHGLDPETVRSRIRILTEKEAREFYLHRKGYDLEPVMLNGKVDSFDGAQVTDSCVYFIDECWAFWGARDWAATGRGLIFYNAQHRKLSDEVYLITQNFKQVDTAIRQVVQDYWTVRNGGNEQIFGFRRPSRLHVKVYQEPPSISAPVFVTRKQRIHLGVGGCYDTSGGVGVGQRRVADLQQRKKGLPWSMIWVVAALITLAVIGVWWVGTSRIEKMVRNRAGQSFGVVSVPPLPIVPAVPSPPAVDVAPAPLPSSGAVPSAFQPSPGSGHRIGVPPIPDQYDVSLVGVSTLGGKSHILLSDGSAYAGTDPEVQLVTEKFVVILGKVYRWPKKSFQIQ